MNDRLYIFLIIRELETLGEIGKNRKSVFVPIWAHRTKSANRHLMTECAFLFLSY